MSTQANPAQGSTIARPDDGGSAFPVHLADQINRPGMSLRDYFAAAALQGMLACPRRDNWLDVTCENAYRFADMMIVVRANKGGAS